jgi:hypothetical protein
VWQNELSTNYPSDVDPAVAISGKTFRFATSIIQGKLTKSLPVASQTAIGVGKTTNRLTVRWLALGVNCQRESTQSPRKLSPNMPVFSTDNADFGPVVTRYT